MSVKMKLNSLELDVPAADDVGSIGSMGAGGFYTKRSISSDLRSESGSFINDEGVDPSDLCLDLDIGSEKEDDVFQRIKDSVSQQRDGSQAGHSSHSGSIADSPQIKISDDYQSVPYGIQPRATYEHGKRSTEIMGVTYNGRMRQFIIIDSKGITAWKRDAVDHRVNRVLFYPKYEYGLITHMVYAKKYNCYFALGKDFSLKVYNRDFYETCSVSADLRSVLFMLFNPIRDELITGGVGGTKVWRFHQQSEKSFTELKPLANYGLTLKYELPNVGGSWVKRVELDHHLEHLYCCSDTDLYVYDLGGKLLFKFERAHMMSITGCRYSLNAGVLVTCSIDCEVKVWSLIGGLVHTFRGHSRAVTNLILHPLTSSIVITCSLDGTVRMWSLDTMDTLYSLVVSADGVHWMGLTDDNQLFLSTPWNITLWNLNYSHQFWALARSKVTGLSLVGCKAKSTRVMAISDDSSVRLIARGNKKNLCTVLPPPSISPLQRVLSVCYSREFNVIFMLINPHEIWVYTTRTDPSCRIAVWDVIRIQARFSMHKLAAGAGDELIPSSTISVNKAAPTHRATEGGSGNEALVNCCCVSILNSTAILWTDEGCCCPIRDSYLLLGLEDGRILFMDPVIKGHKYLEFKTGKDPVLDMSHNVSDNSLLTVHKLKDRMFIQVWSLPDLELQHEVHIAPDLRAYTRVGYVMACGHESGCVIFHFLEFATDPGLNKGRMIPSFNEVIDSSHKPEHFAPVIGVDACDALKIFCSCSQDGAIKIWNEDGILISEIMLDESLSSVCFLNNKGDIIVGLQKHLFVIDHSRVCPQITVPESGVDTCDKESFICEDPAVLYEGVSSNPDPVTLESYLVPFDIEFSKDFLEGRVKLEPQVIEDEESDVESEMSMAPTEVYQSPRSTPKRRLSQIDLLLGSEASTFDLLNQMKKTLAHLAEKERLENDENPLEEKIELEKHWPAEKRRRRKMMKKGLMDDNPDAAKDPLTDNEDVMAEPVTNSDPFLDELTFEFPKFGKSPGPSPVSTAPPTPDVQSEDEGEPLPGDKPQEEPKDLNVTNKILPREADDIAKFLEGEKVKDNSKTKIAERVTSSSVPSPRKKFGLSSYTVDAESLMKKKTPRPVKQEIASSKPQAVKASEVSLQISEAKSPRKSVKKRMSISQRRSSRANNSDIADEHQRASSPPSSQMETLGLKQQMLDVPDRKRFEMPTVNLRRQSKEFHEEEKDALFEDKMHEIKFPQKNEIPLLPALPSMPSVLPDGDTKKDNPQTKQTSDGQSSQVQDSSKRSAMDFSSLVRKPPPSMPSATMVEESGDQPDGKQEQLVGGDNLTAGVNEAVYHDQLAASTKLSEDGKVASSGVGLLSMQNTGQTNGHHQGTFPGISETPGRGAGASVGGAVVPFSVSDSQVFPVVDKSATPRDTPDQIQSQTTSRPMSEDSSTNQFAGPAHSSSPDLMKKQQKQLLNDQLKRVTKSELTSQFELNTEMPGGQSANESMVSGEDGALYEAGVTRVELTRGDRGEDIQPDALTRQQEDSTDKTDLAGLLPTSDLTRARERPKTSMETPSLGKPELDDAVKYFRQRPRTAQVKFQTEDLQEAFDNSLSRYQEMATYPLASDNIHRNGDMAFSENWHQRQIERHMLIRMQKELRAQSARQKRQVLAQSKSNRQKQFSTEGNTAPQGAFLSRAFAMNSLIQTQRSNTVHGFRSGSTIPMPTPVSSRPHTATGLHAEFSGHQQQQQIPQQNMDKMSRLQDVEMLQREKSELSQEKAFRLRLNQKEMEKESKDESSVEPLDNIDLWLIDPRNPHAMRAKSSKSIPSKCHRYVLVSKPKVRLNLPLPSPLEEELLASRFPDQGERVFRKYEGLLYKPPRRPIYGIEYSRFQASL